MTEFSPAQKALSAFNERCELCFSVDDDWVAQCLAAALEAVADQVVPEEEGLNPVNAWNVEDWNHMNITRYQREETRRQLLAIAAELRGDTTTTETP